MECMSVKWQLLDNVLVVSAVLKVDYVKCRRLGCLLVLGDSVSRISGWSRWLIQIVGVAIWSDHSRRQSKMWTHRLQRLDDQCPCLFSPWLTGGMSMWPRRVDASPSRVLSLENKGATA